MQATLAFVTDAEFSLASGKTITNGYGGDAAGNSKGVFSSSRRANKKVSGMNLKPTKWLSLLTSTD